MASPDGAPTPFVLSSEQCELLRLFETHASIPALARAMGRDASVISRQLQRLSTVAPVLEKRHGRWCLTERGRRLSVWADDAARAQRQILEAAPALRVVSTREFSARVLAPRIHEWVEGFPRTRVALLTHEDGVESALLAGRADIGFDCGRADDPDVRFRALTTEPFAVVAASKLAARVRGPRRAKTSALALDRLLAEPHLAYDRIRSGEILGLAHEVDHVVATFNDIASARSACVAGLGWAVLPAYAVRDEVQRGELVALADNAGKAERFGVFWLRDRPALASSVRSAVRWLAGVSLTLGG